MPATPAQPETIYLSLTHLWALRTMAGRAGVYNMIRAGLVVNATAQRTQLHLVSTQLAAIAVTGPGNGIANAVTGRYEFVLPWATIRAMLVPGLERTDIARLIMTGPSSGLAEGPYSMAPTRGGSVPFSRAGALVSASSHFITGIDTVPRPVALPSAAIRRCEEAGKILAQRAQAGLCHPTDGVPVLTPRGRGDWTLVSYAGIRDLFGAIRPMAQGEGLPDTHLLSV